MDTTVVKVREALAEVNGVLRHSVNRLRTYLQARELHSEVVFDLSEITFVSRAFAHEFLCLVEELQSNGKSVILDNVSADVNLMLDRVKASASRKPDASEPNVELVTWETVDAFLQ